MPFFKVTTYIEVFFLKKKCASMNSKCMENFLIIYKLLRINILLCKLSLNRVIILKGYWHIRFDVDAGFYPF